MTFLAEWASPYEWAAMMRDLEVQTVPGRAGEKRPLGEWGEFQKTMVPQAQWDRWFHPVTGEHRKSTALGLLTGACSRCGLTPEETSGLFLLDLDTELGLLWWRTFVSTYLNGIEPETWRARSGGGGLHLYFMWPASAGPPPTFKCPARKVDGRGQGGYAVTPPSIHPNGKPYEWEEGFEPWELRRPAMASPELVEAVERLRLEGGGHADGLGPAAKREIQHDGSALAGLDTDGREDKMLRAVWGAIVDLYRDCPIEPSRDVQDAELARVWSNYELTTKTRLSDATSNADGLEREGRGRSALLAKWVYAMRGWDTKVAEAAKIPKPDAEPRPAIVRTDSTLETWDQEAFASLAHDVGDLHGEPPPQQWLARDWIPLGKVTLLGGAGGTGKSLAALILAHCLALGLPWLGLETVQGDSLYVSCEDEDDELHRRHTAIKLGLGHAIGNPFAGHVKWLNRTEADNRLAVLDQRGGLTAGPFLAELRAEILTVRPALLVLDTIADVFGGDENNRVQVNGFVKMIVGGLIRDARQAGFCLTPLLLGHPSKASLADGTGYSGSTAWENSVRSRITLGKPKSGNPDQRTLKREKANYAGGEDDELRLMWENGILHPLADIPDLGDLVSRVVSKVQSAWWAKSPYQPAKGHARFLHKLMVDELRREGHGKDRIILAIEVAIEDRLIVQSSSNGRRGWRSPTTGRAGDD